MHSKGIAVCTGTLLMILPNSGCAPSGPPSPSSTAMFTPGSGDSLGTFSYDGGSFELQSDAEGKLAAITSEDVGSFSIDENGNLSRIMSLDGGVFVITRTDAETLSIDVDDPELGMLIVSVSLTQYPALRTARSVVNGLQTLTVHSAATTPKTSPTARELDDFGELDLSTFCQITNGCALAELYATLFLDDVVDMIQSDLVIVPRSIIQGQVDDALKAQREFCQEWNGIVQELDDNPCTSSDDPEPETPEDCSPNGACNVNCPDTEPDPDCSNAEICAAKGFCCVGDQVCDIQRCNELDADCTNFDFCDRLATCCDDDDRCDTTVNGHGCPESDDDCAYCGNLDDVCILNCSPSDPDCEGSDTCPRDDFCEVDCAGADPDCALCGADESSTCINDCDPPDPDCTVVTNITAEGSVSSSSVYQDRDDFQTYLAVDGSTGTNWFSDGRGGGGPGPEAEVFTWVFNEVRNTSITRIETDPDTFEGGGKFGFASVQVLVQDLAGETVYDSGVLSMSAFRVDLNLALPEGVEGRTIILTLIVHQDNSCGGFSEFRVFGLRDVGEL